MMNFCTLLYFITKLQLGMPVGGRPAGFDFKKITKYDAWEVFEGKEGHWPGKSHSIC